MAAEAGSVVGCAVEINGGEGKPPSPREADRLLELKKNPAPWTAQRSAGTLVFKGLL
jgi:hypothetical protein